MKRFPYRRAACTLFLLLGLLLPNFGAGKAAPVQPQDAAYVPDELLLRFDPSASAASIDTCLLSAGASRRGHIDRLSALLLKVPPGQVAAAAARLGKCAGVVYAEPNYLVQAAEMRPSDAAFSAQWGLLAIHAPLAWDLSTGADSVTIAVVDSGVDLSHPDLAGKIVAGYDFVNNDADPTDDFGHGTHVAGIAAAVTNNAAGMAGVSWGARIMPVKVLNASGNGSYANVAAGIIWAADHGAQVINLSLGGTSASATLQDAVNYAYSLDVTIVAAAGNVAVGSYSVLYPARLPHVIAVTAIDNTNTVAGFSRFGPEVDVAAPGVDIFSTLPAGTYGVDSGTSMASPFVAGLAALLRSLHGNTSPDLITSQITATALDIGAAGFDDFSGFGLIQADAAVRPFFPAKSILRILKGGNGSGTVSNAAARIDCGDYCASFVDTGVPVTLAAAPSAGSLFTGWSGGSCTGTGACTLPLAADTTVTAAFTLEEYTLAVLSANGTVTRSPDQATYHYDDVVRLTAIGAPGYSFVSWSGGALSYANPLDFTILGSTTLTANFALRLYLPYILR